MGTRTVLRQAALIEHAVLRVPLQIVDDQVVRRCLHEESAVRRLFEQALRAYDQAAESWRPDPGATGPTGPAGSAGSAFDRVAETTTATDTTDERNRDADTVDDTWGGGLQHPEPAPEQVEELAEELIEEQETETFVGELAENDDLRHVQAELQAKRLLEEQGE